MAKQLSKKNLFIGKIFDVNEFEYESKEQGKFKRQIIHMHNDAVAVLLWDKNNHLVYKSREFRSGLNKTIDSITAGKINHGETPKEALYREVLEETGIKLNKDYNISQIATINSSEGAMDEKVYLFAVEIDSEHILKEEPKFDSDEYVTGEFVNDNEWCKNILSVNSSGPAIASALWLKLNKN